MWPVWFGADTGVVPSTEPESFGMVAMAASVTKQQELFSVESQVAQAVMVYEEMTK